MALSAVCSSRNAPVAPRKRVTSADDRGQDARRRPGGALEHRLHRLGALAADQPLDLAHDLAPHRLAAEDQPGDGDGDQQHRERARTACSRRATRRAAARCRPTTRRAPASSPTRAPSRSASGFQGGSAIVRPAGSQVRGGCRRRAAERMGVARPDPPAHLPGRPAVPVARGARWSARPTPPDGIGTDPARPTGTADWIRGERRRSSAAARCPARSPR